MALPSLSFVAAVFILIWLSTFILFAIVRVLTGISIQRVGFSGLRRISYTARDGLHIEIRGLGLQVHRPTFTQPTWVSLVVEELKVTLDLDELSASQRQTAATAPDPVVASSSSSDQQQQRSDANSGRHKSHKGSGRPKKKRRNKVWQKLTDVKEKVKRLHNIVPWLRLIDCRAEKSAVEVRRIGTLHVGSLLLSVDTRLHAVDRSRMFTYRSRTEGERTPAEWSLGVRNVLFTTTSNDSIDVLDHCVVNVYGFLYRDVQGLRDASVSVKVGRIHIPYDHVLRSSLHARQAFPKSPVDASRRPSDVFSDMSDTDLDVATPGGEDEDPLVRRMAEAKDFVSSILRGIHEVSFAVSFISLAKTVEAVKPGGRAVTITASLKEVGMDIYRLDPTTPAQAMYFARGDIAHQALLSAISVSVGVGDGDDEPERLFYIPMTTTTVKTTLPAKLLQLASHASSSDRNANVFFANIVITSPSIDLDPRHLPLVLALLASRRARPTSSSSSSSSSSAMTRHGKAIISRFLPKASIKLSIQEPVVRVALPAVEQPQSGGFAFDLLIFAISSVTLEIESEHSTHAADVQYLLTSNLRVASHKLYYQTASKRRHDLLQAESVELRAQLTASPQVNVVASASFQTFSLFMVRPEINDGVQQIIRQLRSGVQPDKLHAVRGADRTSNVVRKMPAWLQTLSVSAADFNIEVAGQDAGLSSQPRGVAVHLESFTTDYRINKDDQSVDSPAARRRTISRSMRIDDLPRTLSPPPKLRRAAATQTDGRRVAVHIKGFEAFIIQGQQDWEASPFISLPSSEIALTTSNDGYGPVLHVMSLVKTVYLQYSLFRHYCLGVAFSMLRKTFASPRQASPRQASPRQASSSRPREAASAAAAANAIPTTRPGLVPEELIALDVRAHFVQVKAQMPTEPHMLLHIHELELEKHRWTRPFVRAHVVRLHCTAPSVTTAWNRIVSVKNVRLDLRESRRRNGPQAVAEKSWDVSTDAIRIGIPHQLIVHKIFDNLINTAKTAQQLHHRFKTGSDEYILQKEPEGPKHVPKLTLRTDLLLFELEDGAFEWKLGVIFRTGLIEQKQRLAREAAFRMKCRSMNADSGRAPSDARSKSIPAGQRDRSISPRRVSTANDQRPTQTNQPTQPNQQGQGHARHDSTSRGGRNIRYDRDGACTFSAHTQTTVGDAWERLQTYNAQSWRKRVDRAMSTSSGAVAEIRRLSWGMDAPVDADLHDEVILQIPNRPALAGLLLSDLNITIDKPSFPLSELPSFMFDVGKGLPKDTQFSLLVPLNAHFEMGEARLVLRDYPLPLFHIPAIKAGQSARLRSWSLRTDFVIGEEFRDSESTRDLQIEVVPADKLDPDNKERTGGFAVDVRRTVAAVKTYSNIKVEIHTAKDTRFTWGTSYQPAIQDMMQVIEGFTKPQIDPSDKVGFWDKIRLVFHSRVNVAWTGGGDCHLLFKGSRDPYMVTGHGAGFVMVWRNDVRLNIRQDDDPTKFLTVESGDYVFAIPDFGHEARQSSAHGSDSSSGSSIASRQDSALFKKVVMKLSGRVRWMAGLVFERNLDGGGRSFQFAPHYDVTLKNPAHFKARRDDGAVYDAFRGFRSNYIHMSIAISAPADRDWAKSDLEASTNYNSVHLTPRFFTHFFAWWSLFSGIMSLPIRQGPLFPAVEKSGKKFGRHLATIKYSLLLSPLFMSHVYKHKDAEDFKHDDGSVAATGLKVRLDSFVLDLHQRREEFETSVKGLNKMVKTTGMRINRALVDLVAADIRAVSACITGTSLDAVKNATDERVAAFTETATGVDLAKFVIPDNDFIWIDVDDFVEIDWTLPMDQDPDTKILPIVYAPRFTYRRQTDHNNTISGQHHRTSPFGYEDTHDCLMDSQNDSRQVQLALVRDRLHKITEAKEQHSQMLHGQGHLSVEDGADPRAARDRKLQELRTHLASMEHKETFLSRMVEDLERRMGDVEAKGDSKSESRGDSKGDSGQDAQNGQQQQQQQQQRGRSHTAQSARPTHSESHGASGGDRLDAGTMADQLGDFNNRFVVHNAQIKWNNSLRDIMLRYIHQVSQRRGFVYYTSRRAVKFILDIVDEQQAKASSESPTDYPSEAETPTTPQSEADGEVQDRIKQLLQDARRFVKADDQGDTGGEIKNKDDDDDGASHDGAHHSKAKEGADQNVSQEFVVQNTYHVRLVAPQIQLQSEKNPSSAVLITARGMRLKVFQIMDKDRVSDDVSGLVQRRFGAEMDNMQFFVSSRQRFSPEFLHIHTANTYGSYAGRSWPPWVPIEVMFDFHGEQYGFARVVQRTSASLRFDKYNKLRLKYNESVSGDGDRPREASQQAESRMDHLWVDFPQLRAICDSAQYFAMYIIVMDLLLYQEPLEKTRDERLEKIMLASDFSDLRGAPELVSMLQDRIRQLEELKTHFHVHEKFLDRQGWEDRIALERDLTSCEDELFFMMKAITTSQQKRDERRDSQANGLLRYYLAAKEIVWHLVREEDTPLVEFQLGNASFERQDNSDGSNFNAVEIDRIRGLNLLDNAIYPEILVPYLDPEKPRPRDEDIKMVSVKWHMLEAIAGIPVVDHFEVNTFPLKVSLEYEVGSKLFEYVFPGARDGREDGFSPFMVRSNGLPKIAADDDDAAAELQGTKSTSSRRIAVEEASKNMSNGTGAGELGRRLQPTHKLPDVNRRPSSQSHRSKSHSADLKGLRLHQTNVSSLSNLSAMSNERRLSTRASAETLETSQQRGRELSKPSTSYTTTSEAGRSKRFAIRRSQSTDSRSSKPKRSDDLSQMLSRASNYMTLSYAKMSSVVLCLSYHGKGTRNLEDVHDLVFRMPTLEYRNKTWSNLDLALALKKDVIRALISHTGSIIGNKFHHHKPARLQASRLRDLVNSETILGGSRGNSKNGSLTDGSRPTSRPGEDMPRTSDVTDDTDSHNDNVSYASSLYEPPSIGFLETRPGTVGSSSNGDRDVIPIKSTLTRHFSELANRAKRSNSLPESDGGGERDREDGESNTGRRARLVQKILHPKRD